MKVDLKLNPVEFILARRKLGESQEAQKFFSGKAAEYMNPYVPFLTGNLKDVQVDVQINKIIYEAPYAKKQFYTNAGMGRDGNSYGGLRGKRWCTRMKADRMSDLTREVANYIGGRAK